MSDHRLALLETAVRAAGQLALGYFGKVAVEHKADRSVVTEADRAVERYLVEALRGIEPGARILGEEGTETAAGGAAVAAATWAIDPIDGTAVFVAGLPTWSISVGLVRDGHPELGCVYLPVTGEMYLAGPDGPLLWNGVAVDRTEVTVEPSGPERGTFLCMPANHHRRFRVSHAAKVRSFGSTAAHFAWTARGASLGAVAFAHVWDIAAGLACCRAAGVEYSYLSGRPVELAALLAGERTGEPVIAAFRDDIDDLRQAIEVR